MLGSGRLSKIGWIFTQSTKERDFIMSSEEICQIAGMSCSEEQVNAVRCPSAEWVQKGTTPAVRQCCQQAQMCRQYD